MKIYLAGPDVFLPNPLDLASAKQAICEKYGFVGRFALDSALNFTGLSPHESAWLIYQSNLALMNDCDLIVANMTPFRSPSMDVGTAFEMGYMAAQGKFVFGYSNDGRLYENRVPVAAPSVDEKGLTIEAFELPDNLMMLGAIHYSNGAFQSKTIAHDRYFTELSVFEAVLKLAAARLLQ